MKSKKYTWSTPLTVELCPTYGGLRLSNYNIQSFNHEKETHLPKKIILKGVKKPSRGRCWRRSGRSSMVPMASRWGKFVSANENLK
jgi:hypothetical protein